MPETGSRGFVRRVVPIQRKSENSPSFLHSVNSKDKDAKPSLLKNMTIDLKSENYSSMRHGIKASESVKSK